MARFRTGFAAAPSKALFSVGACALIWMLVSSGAAAQVIDSIRELAGRYQRSVTVRDLGSDSGPMATEATDVVEIVPRGGGRAWFRISLAFDNGHSCELIGTARQTRAGLIHYGSRDSLTGRQCVFRIWREGDALRWSDGDNSCISYCGMRGRLSAGRMPYATRTPIGRQEARRLMRDGYTGGE